MKKPDYRFLVGKYPITGPIRFSSTGLASKLPYASGVDNSAPFSKQGPVEFLRSVMECKLIAPAVEPSEVPAAKIEDILGMSLPAHARTVYLGRKAIKAAREVSTDLGEG